MNTPTNSERDSVESTSLLCPIFDRNGDPMNVGDRFTYQGGTEFSSVVEIFLRDGAEWLSFSDGTPSTPLHGFWFQPTDGQISIRHNAKEMTPPLTGGVATGEKS